MIIQVSKNVVFADGQKRKQRVSVAAQFSHNNLQIQSGFFPWTIPRTLVCCVGAINGSLRNFKVLEKAFFLLKANRAFTESIKTLSKKGI